MIGSALKQHLESGGHEVTSLVRTQPTSSGQAYWDPTKGELDSKAAELSAQLGSLPAGEGASAIEALRLCSAALYASTALKPVARRTDAHGRSVLFGRAIRERLDLACAGAPSWEEAHLGPV